MGSILFLMAEASAVKGEMAEAMAEGGIGLDFDVLETNLINIVIIVGVLIFFGRKFIGKTLSDRRERIETAITSAERRASEAATALADQQQKLAQAQAEAERIRKAAEENAKVARENILAAATADIERMKETANRDLNTERERAVAQLRQQVVALALEKVESDLRTGVGQDAQQKLVDRSIALLGG